MEKGGWTPDKITETIKNGKPYNAPNKPNPTNTATGYKFNGSYVVVDDVTNEVIQLGEPGYIVEELPPITKNYEKRECHEQR